MKWLETSKFKAKNKKTIYLPKVTMLYLFFMTKNNDNDLELIDDSINEFVQAMSRPRAWGQVAARAGVSIDRAGATLLYFLEQPRPESCHLNDIAHILGIEAPSVTRKVQQLERQKLIHRVPDPSDKRAYVLQTTVEGRRVIERLSEAKKALFSDILKDWSLADRHNFAILFNRLSRDMSVYRENIDPAPLTKKGSYESR